MKPAVPHPAARSAPRCTNRRRRAGVTILDVLIAVGVVALLSAAVTAGPLFRSREQANRVKCASNLRQVALAALMYSNAEVRSGSFPRTYWNTTSDKLITDTTGYGKPNSFDRAAVGDNNVTASFFLLLKTQDITGEVFICPSSTDERGFGKDAKVGVQDSSNWEKIPGNLSYSYACPFPTQEAVAKGFRFNNALPADYPLAADMNPGTADLTKVLPTSGKEAMRPANSKNHKGDGQNIAYADGHVEFQATVFAGPPLPGEAKLRDNVYTYGEVTATKGGDGIVGRPTAPTDAVLLPAAPAAADAGGPGGATTKPAAP
jgi:prepilin-type processing-associated H-X9-DG protein